MNRINELNVYVLNKYLELKEKKGQAVLKLEQSFPGITNNIYLGVIELDDDDIEYLRNKYKISELRQKEIEQEGLVKKLNSLQSQISYLREQQ
jgi:hypothetical protein